MQHTDPSRQAIYQDSNGREYPAVIIGRTPAGAHLAVEIDGEVVVKMRVPRWQYAEVDDVPVVKRTGEMDAIEDSGEMGREAGTG